MTSHDIRVRPVVRPVRARRRPTVFVAEDDPALRTLLRDELETVGLRVVEVEDGIELLDRIGTTVLQGEGPPSVIVCDHRMPGADGLDVLAGLRAASWSLPFVLMTAFASPALRDRARRLGAAAVFDKPADLTAVCRTVLALIGEEPR